MEIYYTEHARLKFEILAQDGWHLTESKIRETVLNPRHREQDEEKYIAYSSLDRDHLLGVVYQQESARIRVITFYPKRL